MSTTVTIRIDSDLHGRLSDAAENMSHGYRRVTVGMLANEAISDWLDNNETGYLKVADPGPAPGSGYLDNRPPNYKASSM